MFQKDVGMWQSRDVIMLNLSWDMSIHNRLIGITSFYLIKKNNSTHKKRQPDTFSKERKKNQVEQKKKRGGKRRRRQQTQELWRLGSK